MNPHPISATAESKRRVPSWPRRTIAEPTAGSTVFGQASLMDDRTEQQAWLELRLRQLRLGTAGELPEDYQRVCDLAHLLNNRLTAKALMHPGTVPRPA